MLGYVKNKRNFYTKDFKDFQLREAIAYSGGTQRHYAVFNALLNYSIWNTSLNGPIHDTRAAQACIFLYPAPVRIFLALLLYKEELNLVKEFSSFNLSTDLILPSTQILYSNISNRVYMSKRLLTILDTMEDDPVLTDDFLGPLKLYFNIKESLNLDSTDITRNILTVFNTFNESREFNTKFIEVAYSNNRMDAVVALCNQFNYKPKSTNLILQTTERWLLKTSNT